MSESVITLLIDKRRYRVAPSKLKSLDKIPASDREALIELADAIQRVTTDTSMVNTPTVKPFTAAVAESHTPNTLTSGQTATQATSVTGTLSSETTAKPERMGAGDVDALMARLIAEERQQQKPAMTKQQAYKYLGIGLVVFFLLVLIF